MLIAAMNPCPCGNYNNPKIPCTCGPGVVQKYLGKISGPLLDRIDLHVEVKPLSNDELLRKQKGESSSSVRERVVRARNIQAERYRSCPDIHCNAQVNTKLLHQYCSIDEAGNQLMKVTMDRLGLSARAYDRILKVARTIADLDGSPNITTEHLSEAINFRSLDRDSWGR